MVITKNVSIFAKIKKMAILEHNKSNNSNNGMEINNKNKKYFEGVAYEYLQKHAKYVKRVAEEEAPDYFYETKREMEGVYGWFNCEGKEDKYMLPIYVTGWCFEKETDYLEFLNLIGQ